MFNLTTTNIYWKQLEWKQLVEIYVFWLVLMSKLTIVFCNFIIFRLQLKRGLFWTDIIQNCTKWSNMGVHGLSYGPFVAKLHCASFLIRKNEEKSQYGRQKTQTCCFSWKQIFEKLHASHQSWKKQMFQYNPLTIY